jgi:sec-independent protein translocase protein TatC
MNDPDLPTSQNPKSLRLIEPDKNDELDDELEASRAPLMEHLTELRQRMIVMVAAFGLSFVLCFTMAEPIYMWLLHPFEMASRILEAQKITGHNAGPFDLMKVLFGLMAAPANIGELKLIYTAPLEFFFTKVKVGMFGAVVVSFPVIAHQIYAFIAPGLYKRERRAVLPFLMAAPILFSLGALLVYYIILPMVLWFSLSQQIMGDAGVNVQLLPKVSDYLSLVTTLILAFGLCFQLPVVITLLGLAGIVSSQTLVSFRRFAIFGIVVMAAIVTPPDPISQILLAIPIVLLYEISIICVRMLEWRRPKESAS